MHSLRVHLLWVDWLIVGVYFAFTLGVGWALKRRIRSAGDFLLSGQSLPTWVCGLAFLSANLGALEVMGMAGNGYKYGMLTAHLYWVGAIPAMLFVGIFMMPFYYGSKARSVPEYLAMRFDEKTRRLNALCFAALTILTSGINMYAMALCFKVMLGWPVHLSIWAAALSVLAYTYLGGLTSSIYNEVLQFFLIVFGFLPLAWASSQAAGGWEGITSRLAHTPGMTRIWSTVLRPEDNPMGIELVGLVMGLGFVLSFGYWCTDFLVVQRALASKNIVSAQRTPLIAAFPKMLFPFLVILPGLAGVALQIPLPEGNYNYVLPVMLKEFYPAGMLGVGMAALLASFMSGMAGNVTAFNTVVTFDLYQGMMRPDATDPQLLRVGRMATLGGVLASVGAAFIAMGFDSFMDYMQLLFSFFNAPIFATFLLGMFWRRATGHGAFVGLLLGIFAGISHHLLGVCGLIAYPSDQAAAYYGAIWSWSTCFFATIALSFLQAQRPATQLRGLVWSLTPRQVPESIWYQRPWVTACVVLACVTFLNLTFF